MPGSYRLVEAEETEQVVQTIVGLLQARLPQWLKSGQSQQNDQQRQPERPDKSLHNTQSENRIGNRINIASHKATREF